MASYTVVIEVRSFMIADSYTGWSDISCPTVDCRVIHTLFPPLLPPGRELSPVRADNTLTLDEHSPRAVLSCASREFDSSRTLLQRILFRSTVF